MQDAFDPEGFLHIASSNFVKDTTQLVGWFVELTSEEYLVGWVGGVCVNKGQMIQCGWVSGVCVK